MESFFLNISKTKESFDENLFLDKSINNENEIIKYWSDSSDSLSFIFETTPMKTTKRKKVYDKEYLDNIPLPIFECIYCADETISSKHLVSQILTKKYSKDVNNENMVINSITYKLLKFEMEKFIKENIDKDKGLLNKSNMLKRKRKRE